MLKASLAATILTAAMAFAQTSPESWKGDLTGVWQGPYTGDLTRNTSAKLTRGGAVQEVRRYHRPLPAGRRNSPDQRA
jgi:hypothetical protein